MTREVILDTNVFVGAGFNADSASARLIGSVRDGELVMRWNEETRAETLHILRKIPPLRRFRESVPALFRDEHRFSEPTRPESFGFVSDPADRKFAALAVASGATLVTSDDDLLSVRDRIEAPVVTPGELWEAMAYRS